MRLPLNKISLDTLTSLRIYVFTYACSLCNKCITNTPSWCQPLVPWIKIKAIIAFSNTRQESSTTNQHYRVQKYPSCKLFTCLLIVITKLCNDAQLVCRSSILSHRGVWLKQPEAMTNYGRSRYFDQYKSNNGLNHIKTTIGILRRES